MFDEKKTKIDVKTLTQNKLQNTFKHAIIDAYGDLGFA